MAEPIFTSQQVEILGSIHCKFAIVLNRTKKIEFENSAFHNVFQSNWVVAKILKPLVTGLKEIN